MVYYKKWEAIALLNYVSGFSSHQENPSDFGVSGSSCHNPKSSGQSSQCFITGWPNALAFYSHGCDLTGPQLGSCWMMRTLSTQLACSTSSSHHPSCAQITPRPSPQRKLRLKPWRPMVIFFLVSSNKTTFTKRHFARDGFLFKGMRPTISQKIEATKEWMTHFELLPFMAT